MRKFVQVSDLCEGDQQSQCCGAVCMEVTEACDGYGANRVRFKSLRSSEDLLEARGGRYRLYGECLGQGCQGK